VADGIRVTLTAAYASHQAVLAAAVGANYCAPYLGQGWWHFSLTLLCAVKTHPSDASQYVRVNNVTPPGSECNPTLGRMNDAGRDGMGTIVEMQKTVDKLDSDMRILVASVRNVDDIAKLAAQGCDTFTISAKIAEDMFADPLTTQAAVDFEAAAGRIGAYAVEDGGGGRKAEKEPNEEGGASSSD
jgi:transaldolase